MPAKRKQTKSPRTAAMDKLLESRDRRAIKHDVNKLSLEDVVADLRLRGCNPCGTEACLRDRLLRALWLEREPDNRSIPWESSDIEPETFVKGESATQGPETCAASGDLAEKGQAAETFSAHEAESRRPSDSVSERNSPEEIERRDRIVAEVYAPPLSSGLTTAVITTVVSTSATLPTHTTVTPSNCRNPFAHAPRMLGPDRIPASFLTPLPPMDWEYYSARYIRALRDELPARTQREAVPAVHPPPGIQNTRESRQWYTPVQNVSELQHHYDDIRALPSGGETTTSSSDDESQSSSEEPEPPQSSKSKVRSDLSKDAKVLVASAKKGLENNSGITSKRDVDEWKEVRGREDKRAKRGNREFKGVEGVKSDSGVRKSENLEKRKDSRVGEETRESRGKEEYIERRKRSDGKKQRSDRVAQRSLPSETDSSVDTSLVGSRRSEKRKGEKEVSMPRRSSKRTSVCSFESDSDSNVSLIKHNRQSHGDKSRAVRLYKDWGLKFSGEERHEDPEDFLEQLEDCDGTDVSEAARLSALSYIFKGEARRWFRSKRACLTRWASFVRAFKNRFVTEYDRADLMDDLCRRTQGKGEKVTTYLSNIRYLLSKFRQPSDQDMILETVWRNLLPEYRKAMAEKVVDSLEDIEHYGRRWERLRSLDDRYVPPPTADKMHVPGAAYKGAPARSRPVAAIADSEVAACSMKEGQRSGVKGRAGVEESANEKSSGAKSNGIKRNKKKHNNKEYVSGETETIEVLAVEPATINDLGTPQRPYASAVRDNVQSQRRGDCNVRNCSDRRMEPAFNQRPSGQVGDMSRPWRSGDQRQPMGNMPMSGSAVAPRYFAGNAWRSDAPRAFVDACFTCHTVGHRAAECPEIQCYMCHRKGHVIRECPARLSYRPETRQPLATNTASCENNFGAENPERGKQQ